MTSVRKPCAALQLLHAAAVAIACAACAASATAGPPPAVGSGSDLLDNPSARFEHDVLVRFHMHASFGLLRAVERLLLRGKLDEARDLARAIATAPDEGGLSPWAVSATRVRARAEAVATATTVEAACGAEARLASECAACHVATGATPDFASPPSLPPDRPSIDARMARHLWASDRLWEGMVGNADDAWTAGLDVLAATPLPASELGAERGALARKLQRLAARARTMTNSDPDRARSYGEMLATCAACHALPAQP